MKALRPFYWLAMSIIIAFVLISACINIMAYDQVAEFYRELNFPLWLIIPSAIVKIACVAAILLAKPRILKEWAYACLFFNAIIAFTTHQVVEDGSGIWAFIAAILIMTVRIMEEKAYPESTDAEIIAI